MATKPRTVPLTCDDAFRIAAENAGKILPNELHTTSDQKRAFVEGVVISNVIHLPGVGVADGVEMLNLTLTASRGVFPGDLVKRQDTGTYWVCLSNRGEVIEDWDELTGTSTSTIDDIIDGKTAADELTDEIDGGDAGDEFTDEVDGNPEI